MILSLTRLCSGLGLLFVVTRPFCFREHRLAIVAVSFLGLGVTLKADGSAILSWKDNSNNEIGFYIERSEGEGQFKRLATVPSNTTTYLDRNIENGVTYRYRVCAFNSSGNSGFTNIVQHFLPAIESYEQWLSRMLMEFQLSNQLTLPSQTSKLAEIANLGNIPLLHCYVHGLNPFSPDFSYLPKPMSTNRKNHSERYLELATSNFTIGVQMRLQVSQDLVNWDNLPTEFETYAKTFTHSWHRIKLPEVGKNAFYRIETSLTGPN